jgi:hypothetical protein
MRNLYLHLNQATGGWYVAHKRGSCDHVTVAGPYSSEEQAERRLATERLDDELNSDAGAFKSIERTISELESRLVDLDHRIALVAKHALAAGAGRTVSEELRDRIDELVAELRDR